MSLLTVSCGRPLRMWYSGLQSLLPAYPPNPQLGKRYSALRDQERDRDGGREDEGSVVRGSEGDGALSGDVADKLQSRVSRLESQLEETRAELRILRVRVCPCPVLAWSHKFRLAQSSSRRAVVGHATACPPNKADTRRGLKGRDTRLFDAALRICTIQLDGSF